MGVHAGTAVPLTLEKSKLYIHARRDQCVGGAMAAWAPLNLQTQPDWTVAVSERFEESRCE
jgi:hypothetical protein